LSLFVGPRCVLIGHDAECQAEEVEDIGVVLIVISETP
jgi:hypothetical protein